MEATGEARRSPDADAYARIGGTLLIGLLLSIGVMTLGLLIGAVRGGDTTHVYRLDKIWGKLSNGNPAAILDMGILLLFATPLIAVIVAFGEFWRQRDGTFMLVTAALLILLLAGFLIALH